MSKFEQNSTEILDVLRAFAEAYERMRSYGEDHPSKDAPLFAMGDDVLISYELLHNNETEQVTVGHLMAAHQLFWILNKDADNDA